MALTANQFNLVYDALSFSLATMMATTIFLWARVPSVHEKFKSALIISGLVTFIAAYHYTRIFNSWTEAYEWDGTGGVSATTVPFNNTYRYMDWLLTVPLLLIEIVLVMKLPADEVKSKATSLVLSEDNLGTRWMYWIGAMVPFLYIVKTLLIGLADATNSEDDPAVRDLIKGVQWWTVISWCTYPVVYVFPMLGIAGTNVVVAIQIGYSVSDIISKCGVGLMIYQITIAKSAGMKKGNEETPLYG